MSPDLDTLDREARALLTAHGLDPDGADADAGVTSGPIASARGVVAAVAAVRAREVAYATLATTTRTYLEARTREAVLSSQAPAVRRRKAWAGAMKAAESTTDGSRKRLDALLRGARTGTVERAAVSAFATWLRRHDPLAGAAGLADEAENEGAAVIAELFDAALVALVKAPDASDRGAPPSAPPSEPAGVMR